MACHYIQCEMDKYEFPKVSHENAGDYTTKVYRMEMAQPACLCYEYSESQYSPGKVTMFFFSSLFYVTWSMD